MHLRTVSGCNTRNDLLHLYVNVLNFKFKHIYSREQIFISTTLNQKFLVMVIDIVCILKGESVCHINTVFPVEFG